MGSGFLKKVTHQLIPHYLVPHICVNELGQRSTVGSDNGLSPIRHQAFI